jgi:hypothetical protein
MERIKNLPVPEARGSLICDCKGTPFWQTDKTFTQLFSKQYASLIFTHYIYNTREKGKKYDETTASIEITSGKVEDYLYSCLDARP